MSVSFLKKFEEDLLRAYQETHSKIEDRNEKTMKYINNALTPLLNEILQSYYFENSLLPEIIENDYPADLLAIKIHGYLKSVPFSFIQDSYSNRSPVTEDHLITSIDKSKIFEKLKEIDSHYETLLETDVLKRKIHLLKKHEIEFTVIKTDNTNAYEVFGNLNKYLNYEPNFKSHPHLELEAKDMLFSDSLKLFDKMEYFNIEYKTERIFIVAHNHNQIAGISLLKPYTDLNDTAKKNDQYFMKDKMLYAACFMIGDQFRKKGLSIKLMKETFKYAKEHQSILIRSYPSKMGRDYLYWNVNELGNKSPDVFIINHSNENYFKDLKLAIKTVKNQEEYNRFYEKYKDVFYQTNKISNHYEFLRNLIPDEYEESYKLSNQERNEINDFMRKSHNEYTVSTIKNRRLKNV
jgi:predicted GNAT family acetyltransferase